MLNAVEHALHCFLPSRLEGVLIQAPQHFCHKSGCSIVICDESGRLFLDLLQWVNVCLQMRVPNRCCIFKSWAYKGAVTCCFQLWCTIFQVSVHKSQCSVFFCSYILYVLVPWKVFGDSNTQVFAVLWSIGSRTWPWSIWLFILLFDEMWSTCTFSAWPLIFVKMTLTTCAFCGRACF